MYVYYPASIKRNVRFQNSVIITFRTFDPIEISVKREEKKSKRKKTKKQRNEWKQSTLPLYAIIIP